MEAPGGSREVLLTFPQACRNQRVFVVLVAVETVVRGDHHLTTQYPFEGEG